MSDYVQRALTVSVTAGNKSADSPSPIVFPGGGNTLTLEGYQVAAAITMAGGQSSPEAEIAIHGLSQEYMNVMASLSKPDFFRNGNTVSVTAGDVGGNMTQVFSGGIQDAYADYDQAPDVAFIISALSASSLAQTKAPATSFSGSTDVATMMAVLASAANLTLENSGVTVVLSNPYFSGGVLDQIRRCARAANINYHIEGGVLAIWPKNGARASSFAPTVAPATGLVGYPTFSNVGVNFKTLFNPTLVFGTKVNLQSSLPQATGTWAINAIQHSLDSQTPDGDWFTYVQAWGLDNFAAEVASK